MPLTPRDKRTLLAAACVSGAVIVAFVLLAGGTPDLDGPTRPTPANIQTGAPSTPAAKVLSQRDPFSAPPELATAPGTGGPTGREPRANPTMPTMPTIPSEPGSTTTASGSGPPSPPPGPPPPSCRGASARACRVVAGHVVELVRVTMPHHVALADLVVDGRAYADVGARDRFARRFLLVGFNDERCAQIVAGLEGVTLCGPRRA